MANKYGIKEFVKSATIEDIINDIMMPLPFKVYNPLESGNAKLEKNIFVWNIVAVISCGRWCEKCYAVKGYRYTDVQLKHMYNLYMAIHNTEALKELIIGKIIRSRTKEYVRIHGAGDFFSLEYVQMWAEIVQAVKAVRPEIIFYTYTKTKFIDELEMAGIVVNKSLVKGLGVNYGKREKLEKFIEDQGADGDKYVICDATKEETKENTKCGKTCSACMDNEKTVLFIEH